MKKLLITSFVMLLLVSLIGCNVGNEGAQNMQQGYMDQERNVLDSDTAHLQPFNNTHTAQNKQGQTGLLHRRDEDNRIEQGGELRGQTRQNEDRWNEQGLSNNEHGHIDKRPTKEKKEKKKTTNPRFKQIQLLGINDLHGQLNVTRRVNGRPVGRVDYLAAYLKQRAAENKNTIYVHAGDMIGASPPISALLRDEPTIEFLNKMNFDIGAVGNHEFDRGSGELLRIAHGGAHEETGDFRGSDFTWLAANVISEKTGNPILPPYKIIKVDGMDIGFIGVVTTDTPNIVIPSGVAGLKFINEVEAINKAVAELKRRGVRAIVVLAHNPGSSNMNGEQARGILVDIANGVDDEVDIIYGGHNHAYMNTVVDNKLLIQSYSFATAFSDVDIEIDPRTKDIVSKSAEIVNVFQEDIDPDPEFTEWIAHYEQLVEPIVNRIVGTAETRLRAQQNEHGESALGNLIADAQRQTMNTDFAFMNPGGIRADIDMGKVTWGNVYTVQPFNNTLVKMNLTGQQIRQLLNQQWQPNTTRMLQISGLSYHWDALQPRGEKVLSIFLPDGSELDPNQTYSVVANSFLAGGGDSFTVFRDGTNRETGPVDLDALVDYIRTLPQPFTYSIEERIQKVQY
ncbi:MAG: bifunctional metallophosphatase/5'-nucleotidase [Anaerobacillus sp.]|uniref:bifunctional metallophosphatase/5'-nucleotidase n=1 Tax=Anaerobacillus sp. TaxID=1872506 RepID=UPI00391C3B83